MKSDPNSVACLPSSRANTTIFYYLDKLCHKYDCIILSWIETAKWLFISNSLLFQVMIISFISPTTTPPTWWLNLSRLTAPQKARDQAGKGHHWDTCHELHRQHPSSSWSPYTTISWVSNVRQLCLKKCVKTKLGVKTKLVYIYIYT